MRASFCVKSLIRASRTVTITPSPIEAALPLLQDPQNAYRILGSLEFSGAKAQVSSWIAKPEKPEKPEKEE